MKKVLFIISILTISFGLSAQTVVSGNITGIWEPDGNPYIVVGDINIVDSLIIEAGVLVQFQAGGWMIQSGGGARFLANGTDEEPIVFEPYQGNEPESWDYINIHGSGNDDTLKYCRIRNAVYGIRVRNSNTVIIGCEIYSNTIGIYILDEGNGGANANINNCSIHNNLTGINANGSGGWYNDDAFATITNSIISFNIGYGISNSSGGQIGAEDIIYNCLWGNATPNFGGISIPSGFGINGAYQNFNGDSCDINFNIYNNPFFIDTNNANFNLQPISKCIDAGTNLIFGQFTYDPDGTMPDMGANYYPHSNAAILAYGFPEQTGPADIDDVNKQITIEVLYGTDVTNLVADFNLAGGATATVNGEEQESGVTENDFTYPVTYVVTSSGGTNTQNWLVTVNVAVGINEIKTNNVLICPNPFMTQTSISFDNPNHSNYKLSIFNTSGNKVFEKNNITSDIIAFERGNLTPGIYIIELRGEKVFKGKMLVKEQ